MHTFEKLCTDTLNSDHCNRQPVFKYLGYKYGDFPESERASREVLSLPMHPFLEKVQQKKVAEEIAEALNN